MMALLRFWKFRRIAYQLAQRIGSEAWKAGPRIFDQSEKAEEVMVHTKEGDRIWDSVAIVMAFGIHVVDHYLRNYFDEKDRIKLLNRLSRTSIWEFQKSAAFTAANDGRREDLDRIQKRLLEVIPYAVDKFAQCNFIHFGGPEERGQTSWASLNVCGILLMTAFIEDSDVPQSTFKNWEELEPKKLKLYDVARAVAWNIHEHVKEDLYRSLEAEGFRKIREVGTAIQ